MKIYEMTLSDLHKIGYIGSGEHSGLRLNGQKISDPKKADVIIIPLATRETSHLTPQLWYNIIDKFAKIHDIDERRFVTFDVSDFEFQTEKYHNGTFIRSNLKGWMKRKMPRSISWPWPVEDYKECIELPEDGFKYDIGGHMWLSSNVRTQSCNAVENELGEKADICTYKDFCGYIWDTPEGLRRRKEFRRSLRESRLQLCPRSIHNVFPYRFFEAMSAGRVPVLLCDDYVLPWQNKIDWDSCTIRFGDQDANKAGILIRGWLSNHNDKQIIEMGLRARKYFDDWLHRDRWPDLHTKAIEELFRSEGLIRES